MESYKDSCAFLCLHLCSDLLCACAWIRGGESTCNAHKNGSVQILKGVSESIYFTNIFLLWQFSFLPFNNLHYLLEEYEIVNNWLITGIKRKGLCWWSNHTNDSHSDPVMHNSLVGAGCGWVCAGFHTYRWRETTNLYTYILKYIFNLYTNV